MIPRTNFVLPSYSHAIPLLFTDHPIVPRLLFWG